ncbi:MupA/Atu3671 family FMN-dependent luciferase-like monooxygenase [Nioella sp.]|uniref:MupA/Atu3671 family FMN-dependent luciferase-like monooxygenase n=1 Tax=Nioella sp. TaxID=1912091 RepID=UPI003B52B2E4
MSQFTSLIIGHDTLALNCAKMLAGAGHPIRAVVTRCPEFRAWAEAEGVTLIAPGSGLKDRLQGIEFEWILSIANLDILPTDLLSEAAKGAVNFHDGPLPAYAGLNAPVWALLNGETTHGITWHRIAGGVDEGNILAQRRIEIAPGETALTLNTKCYAAALDSFGEVIAALAEGRAEGTAQDLSHRSYFARDARPEAAALLDFSKSANEIAAIVHALDHGGYWNPLACPKLDTGREILLVGSAEPVEGAGAPGEVLEVTGGIATVAVPGGAVRLGGMRSVDGAPVILADHLAAGTRLPMTQDRALISAAIATAAPAEGFWRKRLEAMQPASFSFHPGTGEGLASRKVTRPDSISAAQALARFALLALRKGEGGAVDLACATSVSMPGYLTPWVPVAIDPEGSVAEAEARFAERLEVARAKGPFAADLPARIPGLSGLSIPDFAIGEVPGAALCLSADGQTLTADAARVTPEELDLIAARLEHVLQADPTTLVADLSIVPDCERQKLIHDWNATETDYDRARCIHQMFEAQAAKTPDATALIFEGERLSYAALNARANRVARALAGMGVRRGDLVGLHVRRSADLLIGAIAIHKAGAAYVPLDPDYPADRVALYVEDSGAQVILTEAALTPHLPPHQAQVLEIDRDPRIAAAPDTNPDSGVTPEDLAYLIYTSGSTGRPKGVMIEHRNVSNFFTGMDARIDHETGGVWLAVTSLSFDISVLELFWTLARGFTVVISGDENRTLVSNGRIGQTGRGMEFSLFYWGNDDGVGRDKYTMLLEGAKFADQNGFCAVWTPERHFHAFGGPYPNPSVTGAAVAAVTRNLSVRAGSCVAPLHHPARIAEEWAVIDNLTNGRAALGIASGWQPHDFVLRPENTPPANKPAMYDAIDTLRALWRGEEVAFPLADGTEHKVLTQPRPVSKELAIWVTTAGNPDTWREAGEIGANVLTHLLGQSIDEVGEKIKIYHDALRAGGRDPANHTVTLMLHSYLAKDREEAREVARGPMKDYLRSAAGLIKQFAWAFPAFKKPKGVNNPMQLDLGILSEEELEAILDFAFERYFNDSGLFGTVEDALDRVEQLKRIGVDEIACLIDYGIERQKVLDGLRPIAEVLKRANQGDALAEDDFSIAAQIIRHGVTHLQCTPSMARMLVGNDEAKMALARVKHLMVGGEALPGSLVAELQVATDAHIENMYGPTETTIWSTTQTATGGEGITGVGTPIANTQVYVLDEAKQPVPIGVPGELYIGGEGVARGYWQRPDLTAERFLDDPFKPGNRIYRTGDLVRWRADGGLDFLGRADHQIKLRGYRIEMGEIETQIDAVPGVRQSVVIPREDTPGNVQLAAYYLESAPVDPAKIRDHLMAELPAHMVPAHFVRLDAFPLTPNKKIDRKALPAPRARAAAPSNVTPITAQASTAGRIAAIWTKILGVEGIGPQDHFFDLGGHSLLAVQAHREIKAALGAERLSITDIFRFPVLSALASEVDRLTRGDAPEPETPPTTTAPERAINRAEAMSRRRQMRAARAGRG